MMKKKAIPQMLLTNGRYIVYRWFISLDGKLIRYIGRNRNLTQKQVAEKLGISTTKLCKLEACKAKFIDRVLLQKIMDMFDCYANVKII